MTSPFAFLGSLAITRYNAPYAYYFVGAAGIWLICALIQGATKVKRRRKPAPLSEKEEAGINSATD